MSISVTQILATKEQCLADITAKGQVSPVYHVDHTEVCMDNTG